MTAPASGCPLCPRLAEFRRANRASHRDFFNDPVPSFGPRDARLLIVGLAPGLKGANRTGRPFTGDYAGDLLYATLLAHGLARGTYGARADDGFTLIGTRVTNAVRCVPPQNKPLPSEIRTCGQFLAAEIADMPGLNAILALGQIAHNSAVAALGLKRKDHPFAHGAVYRTPRCVLIASYHCSRYNTNTGVLTAEMFSEIVRTAKRHAVD